MKFWEDMQEGISSDDKIIMVGNPSTRMPEYIRLKDIKQDHISIENHKGYFLTEEKLYETYPIPNIGDTAHVGKPYPGLIYRCDEQGVWYNTGDIAPILETPSPILDDAFFSVRKMFSSGSNQAIKVGDIYTNILSSTTGKSVNYQIVDKYHDGSIMNDAKVDGTIYRKRGNEYLKLAVDLSELDASLWGAKGDGITDDTQALQLACAFGGNIRFGKKHKISTAINLTKDINIIGDKNRTEIVFSSDTECVFNSTTKNVEIKRIKVGNTKGFIFQASDFENIYVRECEYTGIDESVNNYAVNVDVNLSAKKVLICNNELSKCTIFFTDRFTCDDLIVDDNIINDGTRFLVRSLPSHDALPENAQSPKRISFCRNIVNGINTALTDKSAYARVVQASAIEKITMNDNYIYHLNTTEAATVLYWSFGSLDFFRNTVKRIEGREGVIHDKSGVVSDDYGYKMNCGNNIFDQSEIESGAKLETIYKIYSCSNFVATNDVFRGLRCPAYRVYQSVDIEITPTNFTFRSAEIYDHKHPVVVQLIQQCKNVVVENFKVNKISNPDNVTEIGETRLRLVDLYMTFNNGKGIEGVLIQNNQIIESSDNLVLLYAYKNNVSVTGYIKDVYLQNNTSVQGEALCRFSNGQLLGAFTFTDNNFPNSTIAIGATPPLLRLSGNTPTPTGNVVIADKTVVKANSSIRRTIAVKIVNIGDFAKASLDTPILDVSVTAMVSSNNNVSIYITNHTNADIELPACNVIVDVERR